jgi:hypothetical protein
MSSNEPTCNSVYERKLVSFQHLKEEMTKEIQLKFFILKMVCSVWLCWNISPHNGGGRLFTIQRWNFSSIVSDKWIHQTVYRLLLTTSFEARNVYFPPSTEHFYQIPSGHLTDLHGRIRHFLLYIIMQCYEILQHKPQILKLLAYPELNRLELFDDWW